MDVIEVPDFKTSQDFSQWVESLDEKYIQSWKAKDWLAMYDKLISLTDNDPLLEKKALAAYVINMAYPEKMLANAISLIMADADRKKILTRKYFVQKSENISAFIKLYNNYRFEPQQLSAIRELAQNCGKAITENPDIDLSKISGITGESPEHRDNILYAAKKADDIVVSHNSLPGEKRARIKMLRLKNYRGTAGFIGKKSIIKISKALLDASLSTMFHESAHAHLQAASKQQKDMLEKGNLLLPQYSEELNQDFYRLMNINRYFYVRYTEKNRDNYIANFSNADSANDKEHKTYGKLEREAYFGYRKQPVERFSTIFGYEAERTFRHQRNQYSERTAVFMKNYLRHLLGEPVSSKYVNGNIQIEYNSALISLNNKELIRRFDYLMEGADHKLLEALNIREEGKNVVLTIPAEYGFRGKFVEVVRKNNSKNNLLAYTRNKIAKKIDKVAASFGIESNLQDRRMSDSYKNTEQEISRSLEESKHIEDFKRKQIANDLKKVAKIIENGINTVKQFIKNKPSKER